MKRTKINGCPNTKILCINGYIFTLVRIDEVKRPSRDERPCFMGIQNYALQSIIKLKRSNPPKKKKS